VPVHLTNRELDVMAVLWDRGSATVGEVRDHLAENLAYTTILTVLRSLEAKGHVRHEKEGKAFRYFALVEAEVAGDRTLRRLLDKVYLGSREMLVTRLLSDKAVSQDELRRIRQMLDGRLEEVDE
jgi:predicted transcriptional regulator